MNFLCYLIDEKSIEVHSFYLSLIGEILDAAIYLDESIGYLIVIAYFG